MPTIKMRDSTGVEVARYPNPVPGDAAVMHARTRAGVDVVHEPVADVVIEQTERPRAGSPKLVSPKRGRPKKVKAE